MFLYEITRRITFDSTNYIWDRFAFI